MTNDPVPALPAPPNLLRALRTGFDAIANHIGILILPVFLDLLLWLGPHLQIKKFLFDIFSTISNSTAFSSAQSGTTVSNNLDMLRETAESINLMSSLRSYPVGIPSLMATKLPIEVPGGLPWFWDVSSLWVIVILGILLFVVGLGIGSFYFALVAQAATGGGVKLRQALRAWPRAMLQLISLTLSLLFVLLILCIPAGCVLSLIAWSGLSLGQVAIFMFIGVVIWLGFPLVFTPHGIYANNNNVLTALRNSIRITRLTLPSTSIFFLTIFLISAGLDILWRVPADNSWLTLVGVAGHAFIATGLLAASFVYYRDADRWAQVLLAKMARQAAKPNPPG